uniref:NAD(P)H-hydrate epimerase n=1 Tax=Crassostrea virginica TaxID=6565 RepID=A0A8B8BWX0_CRAVI|nr:NAD(P)H-hydrate epimerase-like [Crassostrea virginica]
MMIGYNPSLFYPKKPMKPLFDNLTKQFFWMGLPFLTKFPGDPDTLQASYGLVVDALFGFSFTPPVRPAFAGVLDTLKRVTYPQGFFTNTESAPLPVKAAYFDLHLCSSPMTIGQ